MVQPYIDDQTKVGEQEFPSAIVMVGEIDFNDDEEGQWDDDGSDWIFTDYYITNRYEDDPHIYMGGMTSPTPFNGASVSFVQLSSRTLLWIADWTASKIGEKPLIPDPTSNDVNWKFLGKIPETSMVVVGPDGISDLFRVSGTYFYGHTNPSSSTFDLMLFPRPPWLKDVVDRTIPNDMLARNLIDGSGQGGQASSAADLPSLARQE